MENIEKIEKALELFKYNSYNPIQKLSKKLKTKPEHITLSLLTIFLLIIASTIAGQRMLLLILTFLYPTYKSFKALRTEDKFDDKKWLTYWCVFGFFYSFYDFFYFFRFIPFFHLLITFLLFFLYCSLTNWYLYVYEFLKPVYKKIEKIVQTYFTLEN